MNHTVDKNNPRQLRQSIRSGDFSDVTSGVAPGYVQCNLVILPADFAADFLLFCQRNPKPCPLLAISPEPGKSRTSRSRR